MKTSRTSIDGVHLKSECVDESIDDEVCEIMRFSFNFGVTLGFKIFEESTTSVYKS